MKIKKRLLLLIIFFLFLLTSCTENTRRALKTWNSNITGGINRTCILYSNDGKVIGKWEGKIDLRGSSKDSASVVDNRILFDINNKRVTINGGIFVCQEKERTKISQETTKNNN